MRRARDIGIGIGPFSALSEAESVEDPMAEPTGGNPFDEGVDAFIRGLPAEACPYAADTDGAKREQWLDGWHDAKRYDEDKDLRNER